MRRVLAMALILTACGQAETVRPAATPEAPGGMWAVSFQQELEPWSEGRHGYRLRVECSDGTSIAPPVQTFDVSLDHVLLSDPVYLRFDGPGTSFMAPYDLLGVHPDQRTIAVLTLTGMDELKAAASITACEASVVSDGGDPVTLEPGEPFIP